MLELMLDSEQGEKVNVRLYLQRSPERQVLVFKFRPFSVSEVNKLKTVESGTKLKANEGCFNLATLTSHIVTIDSIKLWKGKYRSYNWKLNMSYEA